MILGQRTLLLSISGLLALSLNLAHAKESDYSQPVTIDAGRQLVELTDNKVTFTDNVVVKQGTMDVRANKLVVIRNEKGLQSMTAYGSPATYYQILDSGQPIKAEAKQIHYDMKARTMTLLKDAQIKQNDNIVTGYRIRYYIDREQMEAESQGGKDRVTTIFLPEQLQNMNNKEAQ
ncbi:MULTISPECIES: lipopolysaccharide transport periplasmic protein LptA [Oceanisphaera]|uniref:Lipopolysaccharide export system protein LptA n=1 Tax=Oceanisphaera ostreae TaxID=914151 RepID=A0ABW3KD98_9GAMM